MRYIDADRLRAEIERLVKVNKELKSSRFTEGIAAGYGDVLSAITSLQQEQPELLGYDKALLEVKGKVDKLYEEASIGLSEYDSGLYNGIIETCMKLRGFIKARLDSDAEVDLEKEIDEKWDEFVSSEGEREDFTRITRHFYELGRSR